MQHQGKKSERITQHRPPKPRSLQGRQARSLQPTNTRETRSAALPPAPRSAASATRPRASGFTCRTRDMARHDEGAGAGGDAGGRAARPTLNGWPGASPGSSWRCPAKGRAPWPPPGSPSGEARARAPLPPAAPTALGRRWAAAGHPEPSGDGAWGGTRWAGSSCQRGHALPT